MRLTALAAFVTLALSMTDLRAGEAPANETCPVMTGNKVDPAHWVEYKGKRVYFCCPDCKEAFLKDPEKYLPRLPQFAKADSRGEYAAASSWSLGALVKPVGIVTLVLVVLTASAGFFRRMKPRLLLKCHKALAFFTVLAALCHATLVFLFR